MSDIDPFAALEAAVKRQGLEETAAKAVSQARIRLVLGRDAPSAFFATLALRLHALADWNVPTACVDGKTLTYNPEWFSALSPEEAKGVVCHEVLHCTNKHITRCGRRDPALWNLACDLAINPILVDAGFTLPKSRIMPGEGEFGHIPRGKSAEEIYHLLCQPEPAAQPQEEQGQDGAGQGAPAHDPGGCGGVQAAGNGSQADARQAEAEWEVATLQAAQVAQQRGTLPGGLARLVEEIKAPAVNWKDVLREFVSRTARNDYSWSPPNRRFIHQGIYLPSPRSEELGEVVLAVDTSGSIGTEMLSLFAAEAQAILDSYDCSLTILYHDAEVKAVDHWQPSDGPLTLHPVGGGGTDHSPVFAWVEQEGSLPTCMVCLTDLYTCFPDFAPAYPVLWAVVGRNQHPAPFGQRVTIET